MKQLLILIFLGSFISGAFSKEYHVAVNGSDVNEGSLAKPFRTISKAAQVAQPGDIITVHGGTYRECVNPVRGGLSDVERIVYQAANGEKVEIKGSEIISGWKKEKSGVWKVVIPNTFFGSYNSCADLVFGDWCDNYGKNHTADIFLNGKSLYEMDKIEKVIDAVPYEKSNDKAGSVYTWYCETDANSTTIWANFQATNPNKELVELSIRRSCFYPEKPGLNYITISGFNVSQAATQWGAPTAEQIGMISTHWNKGWIIENCEIHDSKCSGITLGKERGTGQNVWTADPSIDGSIHYIEVVFSALHNGWNKENIGSHIVRNNEIYNCEQTGICGSMGAVFSLIENNHIHHIHQKKQFSGAELAGIKIHAAIDARIVKNRIHDVGAFGCWFDWMTQGTRISRNLLYNNEWQDLFFEVSHGPFLVDNNILLSTQGIATQSEGGAFVHNLITGKVTVWADPNRFTPYHLPHSTEVAGLSTVLAGDDRFYNNIFIGVGTNVHGEDSIKYGLMSYNSTSAKLPLWGDVKNYNKAIWPVKINNNVYYNGAQPYDNESKYVTKPDFNPNIKLVEKDTKVYLQFNADGSSSALITQIITTELLGKSKVAGAAYENPDGTPMKIDIDYFGNKRSEYNPLPGPFENREKGILNLKVW